MNSSNHNTFIFCAVFFYGGSRKNKPAQGSTVARERNFGAHHARSGAGSRGRRRCLDIGQHTIGTQRESAPTLFVVPRPVLQPTRQKRTSERMRPYSPGVHKYMCALRDPINDCRSAQHHLSFYVAVNPPTDGWKLDPTRIEDKYSQRTLASYKVLRWSNRQHRVALDCHRTKAPSFR
jgi:hypothetical protein